MKTSLFPEYSDKYFSSIAKEMTKEINDKSSSTQYLFKEFFIPKYEPTLKFESRSEGSSVAADIVTGRSDLPYKREIISKSIGDIPKLLIKRQLDDYEMTDIDLLLSQGLDKTSDRVAQILFSDNKKCIEGIYSRLEGMALSAISSGLITLDDENRIAFAIPSSNRFGAGVKWDDPKAHPVDDIEKVIKAARVRGDVPCYILMDYGTFDLFKKNDQLKSRYAAHLNLRDADEVFLNLRKCNEFLLDHYGLSVKVINSFVRTEKNGAQTSLNPWEAGKVVFSTKDTFGNLAYGTLAERRHPAPGVHYEVVDDYILLSKFSRADPFCECTAAQAAAVPVLSNTESIYQLNALDTKWA